MLHPMKRIHLTEEEKTTLELRHTKCNDRKEGDRIKAVLLRSEGWSVPMISQALRLHESTIVRHLNDYREGKLKIECGGSNSQLSESQTQALIVHLEANLYHYVYEIIKYVKEQFSISYSIPGMNKWLHRNGFSYKKPKGYPHKLNREQQAEFIDSYHLLKRALKPEDNIYFADSVHPSMATKLEFGWIRKGKNKTIGTTASRTRLNIIGALKLDDIGNTIIDKYDTINADSIIKHLHLLREKNGPKGIIHLIVDQAPYHRADIVAKAAEELNIKLAFLPPYSPNLNPIERLWKVMNEKVRNNRFFKSAKDFKEAIDKFFKTTLPEIGASLRCRINDNFQCVMTNSH
jgi:transposase